MEVLVAVAVLSIGVVSLIQVFSSSLKLAHDGKVYSDAVFLARQKMDEVLTSWELREMVLEDDFDDESQYHWTVSITPDQVMDFSGGMDSEMITWLIAVEVSWREGLRERSYDLTTLKTMVSYEGSREL
jgi:hypothetical protein